MDEKNQEFIKSRDHLNTPEQLKKVNKYINKYDQLQSEMAERMEENLKIQQYYKGEREGSEDDNNKTFINALLPTIEGQASSLVRNKPVSHFKGKGYSDQQFARTAAITMRTVYNENYMRQKLKRNGRRYLLFGNCIFNVSWDDELMDDFGLPEFRVPGFQNVLIDGRIKNLEDIQKAEFIIEKIGHKAISYAEKEYGEKFAKAITLGNSEPDFAAKNTGDDEESFTLLHIWTRDNEKENLQLIEMSLCGLLLRESDPKEPYYEKVHNKYPYFMAGLYPIEGELYSFGDGKLLKPIQELLNKLYDEVLMAIKFSAQRRTFVDPRSETDPDDFDNDPSHPIFAKNPKEYIYDQPGQGINQVVFQLVEHLFKKIQEITRFSALMTGNRPDGQMTATQAGIQQNQGESGVDDKKQDISKALGEATKYALGLCMEFWSAAKALRISEDKEEFAWVDPRQLSNVPVMIPAASDYRKTFTKRYPDTKAPDFMELQLENGKKATKEVEFDIEVDIGEGLPTNSIALYNIILSLAQLQLPDEMTGQPRPLLGFSQVKQMLEDILGLKIDDYMEQNNMMQQQQGPMMPGQQGPINASPNIPGANMQGQMKGGPGVGI